MGDVHERFVKALSACGPIAKASKNAHHGYSYRGIDDVMSALHKVLADHGLFYVPRCVGQDYDDWQTSKGNRLQCARIAYEFVFYAADGSELVVGPVVGQSADTDDKAPMQALSQAAKNALLHAFCIPVGDGDADAQSPASGDGGRVPAVATDKQRTMIGALIDKLPDDKRDAAREWVGDLDALTKQRASTVIDKLQERVSS